MCLAQGPQRSDAGEAQLAALLSRVKHSTTEPLRSRLYFKAKLRKKLHPCKQQIYFIYKSVV